MNHAPRFTLRAAATLAALTALGPLPVHAQTAEAPAQAASAPPPAKTADAAAIPAATTSSSWFAPSLGVVLDVGYGSQELALGDRDKGLHLGGAELTLSSPLGPWLEGRITAAAALSVTKAGAQGGMPTAAAPAPGS